MVSFTLFLHSHPSSPLPVSCYVRSINSALLLLVQEEGKWVSGMNKVNEGRLGNGGRERRDTREELNRNYDGRALAVDDTAVGAGSEVGAFGSVPSLSYCIR